MAEANALGGARDVPLTAPVMQVLSGLPRLEGNGFVFVGKRAGRPIVNVSKPWARVLKAADIDRARIHDLRHTAASVGVGPIGSPRSMRVTSKSSLASNVGVHGRRVGSSMSCSVVPARPCSLS